MGAMRALPVLALLAALAARAGAEERASLDLRRWETARAPRDGAPGKFGASAPALGFAAGEEDVLARCVFDLPAPLASRALALSLERVRWDATVALDGRELARGAEGDLLLDLPPLGAGKHEVLVRARDLRAASAVLKRGADDDPEGAWLAPVGRAPRQAGVLGAARIVERLPVEVRSARVARGVLEVDLRGRTGEPCDVGFAFSGSGASARVALAPGEAGTVAFAWSGCPRWPARARVAIEVEGRVAKRVALAERAFAFEGGRLRVAGSPVFLALLDAPAGNAKEAIDRAHALGANALATGGFRDDAWFDAVEAEGLLVLVESDLARASANALEDERFWRALEKHWREVVPRLRGRASVVAWSVARGLLHAGAVSSPLVRERLAALAEVVHGLDPTRPVVVAGDDGRALGFDLPWSATPGPGAIALLPPVEPPAGFPERLRLAGDPGFLYPVVTKVDQGRARGAAIRAARVAGALGCDLGAAGYDPAVEDALAPVALEVEPVRGGGELASRKLVRRLASDQEVAFAWTFSRGATVLARGAGQGRALEASVTPPAVSERTVFTLAATASSDRGRASLEVPVVVWPRALEPLAGPPAVLVEGPDGLTGEALLAAGVAWREAPAFAELLERGVTLVVGEGALDEKRARPSVLALVERARRIGDGVLVLRQTTPYPDGVAPSLEGFEPRGARDLALREPLARFAAGFEKGDLEGWPGAEGALPPPALERPLRADARVLVEGAPCGLTEAAGVVAINPGGRGGTPDDGEPSAELLCQVPLAGRARELPAARALLRALVREAGAPRAASPRPLFARVDAELEPELEALALVPRPWSLAALEDAASPVIIIDDAKSPLVPSEVAVLERSVAAGATLLARVPDDAAIARLGSLVPAGFRVEKTKELPVPGLLAGLHAADLFWPTGPGGFPDFGSRFDAAPRALHADESVALVRPGALVEHPFGRGRVLLDLLAWREAIKTKEARRWLAQLVSHLGAETAEPPIRLPVGSWGGVGREGDHMMFYGNSTASARFFARKAGRYAVTVDLGGSKARDGWPAARVVCDARFMGDVTLDGPGPKPYELEVTIPAGTHVLSVSFTNDAYEAPEDRNMTLTGAVLRLVTRRVY
jgi:hypothetical protein